MVHVGSGLCELETEQTEVICYFLWKTNQKVDVQVDGQDDFLVFVHCPFCWVEGLLWLSQCRGLQQAILSGKRPENRSESLCVSCGLVSLLNVLGSQWGENEVQGVDKTCICISITTILIRAVEWIHKLKTMNLGLSNLLLPLKKPLRNNPALMDSGLQNDYWKNLSSDL